MILLYLRNHFTVHSTVYQKYEVKYQIHIDEHHFLECYPEHYNSSTFNTILYHCTYFFI